MSNIIVLGAGMVGSAMARDMVRNHRVTVADIRASALEKIRQSDPGIQTLDLDVTKSSELQNALEQFDLVICAVPGFLGFRTLNAIIEAGKHVVDISFCPENVLQLDALAKAKNITAIVDCGVAPGMDNLILGRYNAILNLTDFECLVGGLPKVKKWPFYYKAPFSPVDVIEEYMRPARFVVNGEEVVREPLTDREFIEFDQVGTLVSFNTDGLRSVIETMPHIRNMKEKTLRYPGHVEYISVLKESGFFSEEKIDINGASVSPLEFTSRILFKEWKLEEGETDITVMRVTVKGENAAGQTEEVIYELYDEYDEASKVSSMARTTGYTATAVANYLLEGRFTEKGVFPPELIGKDEACFNYVLQYLEARNVHYRKTVRDI